MVYHLVQQDSACADAQLSAGEVMEALQACHGDVSAAASMLTVNPFIVERSAVEKIKRAISTQFCFAFPDLDEIKIALQRASSNVSTALQSILDTWKGRESSYERAVEVLSVIGIWKASAEICAALVKSDFDADKALPSLAGNPDVLSHYLVAKVRQQVSDQVKYVNLEDEEIEICLSENGGNISAAVDTLVMELRPQQQVFSAKAQLLASQPWADVPISEVKQFLLQASQEDPPCTLSEGIARLIQSWAEREASYNELVEIMSATNVDATDAEFCDA
eukprot:SAG31_NODE_13639_length_856_cov_0.859974_1_plen_277_part_10